MNQNSTHASLALIPPQHAPEPVGYVVGLDISDEFSYVCLLNHASGEVEEETRLRTTPAGLQRYFSQRERTRIALEAGTHSPWISRQLKALGHEVLVANARHLKLVYANNRKSDRLDAENLARLARLDPHLLKPVTHRSEQAQADLAVIRARSALVAARTQLINHVRGTVKSLGERLPRCSSDSFSTSVKDLLPDVLKPALEPLLQAITTLNAQIQALERQIHALNQTYPDAKLLRQVPGVGPVTALAFLLTLEDKHRFRKSRSVGAFLGLVPRRAQSGKQDPPRGISKQGDVMLRTLLMQCAQHILRTSTPDSDLKRFGQRLLAKHSKGARGRAVTALARKLAVLLHRLWVTGEAYQPFRNTTSSAVQSVAALGHGGMVT